MYTVHTPLWFIDRLLQLYDHLDRRRMTDSVEGLMTLPIVIGILVVWGVLCIALLVCTFVDKCDEAQLKTRGHTTLPNTEVNLTVHSEVPCEDECGCDYVDAFLYSRHLSYTSD